MNNNINLDLDPNELLGAVKTRKKHDNKNHTVYMSAALFKEFQRTCRLRDVKPNPVIEQLLRLFIASKMPSKKKT